MEKNDVYSAEELSTSQICHLSLSNLPSCGRSVVHPVSHVLGRRVDPFDVRTDAAALALSSIVVVVVVVTVGVGAVL